MSRSVGSGCVSSHGRISRRAYAENMSRGRAVLIRYRHDGGHPVQRARYEARLRDALERTLGADLSVRFERVEGDEPWRRSSIRVWGDWDRSRASIFSAVSACLSDLADVA